MNNLKASQIQEDNLRQQQSRMLWCCPPLSPYSPFKGIPGSCGLIMRGQGSRRGTRNSLLEIDHLQHCTQLHKNLYLLNFLMALIGVLLFAASPLSVWLWHFLNHCIASFWAGQFSNRSYSMFSFIVSTKKNGIDIWCTRKIIMLENENSTPPSLNHCAFNTGFNY